MADESIVTLTAPQFENLMETQGLNKTTKGIVDIAAEELGVDSGLTYKGLRDGSWPGFDGMKRYKNLSLEQRGGTCRTFGRNGSSNRDSRVIN